MDSIRPPALSPNVVPRSYTKLNSTYLRGFFSRRSRALQSISIRRGPSPEEQQQQQLVVMPLPGVCMPDPGSLLNTHPMHARQHRSGRLTSLAAAAATASAARHKGR